MRRLRADRTWCLPPFLWQGCQFSSVLSSGFLPLALQGEAIGLCTGPADWEVSAEISPLGPAEGRGSQGTRAAVVTCRRWRVVSKQASRHGHCNQTAWLCLAAPGLWVMCHMVDKGWRIR